MAGHIPYDQCEIPRLEGDEVEVVAADEFRRPCEGGDLHAGKAGDLAGEQGLLNELGQLDFALQAGRLGGREVTETNHRRVVDDQAFRVDRVVTHDAAAQITDLGQGDRVFQADEVSGYCLLLGGPQPPGFRFRWAAAQPVAEPIAFLCERCAHLFENGGLHGNPSFVNPG